MVISMVWVVMGMVTAMGMVMDMAMVMVMEDITMVNARLLNLKDHLMITYITMS